MKKKKKRIKKTRFFKWCRALDAIIGYRGICFGSGVQESFMITPKMLWVLKKIRLHFFLINYRRCLIPTRYLSTLVTTVLQYPSELESKLTRKLFSGFDLHGNLGRQAIMKPKTTPKRKTTTTEG